MLGIRRDAVYTKLDPVPFRALESAFQLARTRGDAYVELAHWLNQILMQPDSDLHRIVRAFGIDHARLAADMSHTLERIRKGGSAMLDFSEHVDRAIERGWIVASLVFGAGRIRTGHLVLGMLDETELTRLLVAISEQFRKLERRAARPRPRSRSSRARPRARTARRPLAPTGTGAAGALPPAPMGKAEALQPLHAGPDRAGPGREDRPGPRPRRRDPPDGRHPDCAAGRTTRSSSARPASARRRSSRASPCGSSQGDVPAAAARTSACARSTSACCRPAPA